jgi:hypothetical protein
MFSNIFCPEKGLLVWNKWKFLDVFYWERNTFGYWRFSIKIPLKNKKVIIGYGSNGFFLYTYGFEKVFFKIKVFFLSLYWSWQIRGYYWHKIKRCINRQQR